MSLLSWERSRSNLRGTIRNYLTSIRASNANQIESFFEGLRNHVKTLSEDRMVVEAMVEFNRDYDELNNQYVPPEWNQSIEQYYQDNFFPKLAQAISGELDYENYEPDSQAAKYLQYYYIADNDNPVGEKDKLALALDGSNYSKTHREYHEIFQSLIQTYGYYDLFLIDYQSGDIVYSVYKETDYATSLDSGPYRNSGLAQIVEKVRESPERNNVQIVDFQTYRPSYGAPAAFLGAPIYNGPYIVGILAIQLPVEELAEVLSQGGDWESAGLGNTGETYLVGSDLLMRSDSRLLVEDPEAYQKLLARSGTAPENRASIELFNTSILLQKAEADTVEKALEGEDGTAVTQNYRGKTVLSSYAPLDIPGLDWAILSEIERGEAFKPVNSIQIYLFVVTAIIAVLVTWIASLAASNFIKPINKIAEGMRRLSQGEIDVKIKQDSEDEFGQLAKDFNQTATSVRQLDRDLAAKKRENDALLLNILPAPVVERLKGGETQIANSVKLATVLFARISGIGINISDAQSLKVTALLSELISRFDRAATKHEVGKVKTNGDLYIAVCGVLKPRLDSTKLTMAFAMEMFGILQKFNNEHQEELRQIVGRELRMSIGIDDGRVLAGVVGTQKFSYDVWGETVTVADFLQLYADPNKAEILVTQEVYERLQDLYQFERGPDVELAELNKTLETWAIRRPLVSFASDTPVEVEV
ncbi:MAG: adenylate/guanylate cyclase domain-containing protein [Cyanobacteriota bacterium]|nr:adenylate/guanylate cyclase domain-containing protein [Cyanobacteriota bacterium]